MKKILLLGDSIRLSYQPIVTKKLEGLAEIVGPEDNCRFAHYTLWNVNTWLNNFSKPDIIHWNNGIWDIYKRDEDKGIETPLEYYLLDLERIIKELKKSEAKIIWATTSPVKPDFEFASNNDINLYNLEANKIMNSHNIEINDLNKVLNADLDKFLAPDKYHLNESGQEECAKAVTQVLMKYL